VAVKAEKETTEEPGRPGTIIWANLLFFAIWTTITVVAVPLYIARFGIGWVEVLAFLVTFAAAGLSITAGYHRLFAHRAYAASAPVRLLYALFGAAAWESSIITWAAHHRFHHKNVDTDEDPYNATRGFWYSHIGWLIVRGAKHEDLSNVPDLRKDPICRWQHRYWLVLAILVNLLMVAALGLLTGNMLGMIVFALLLRVLVLHHCTWLINSAAHVWGSQRWSKKHTARDNWMLSLLTFGEGYHNYHHTFQADYRNGPIWHNWDPSKWLIWSLSRIGLTTKLRRVAADVVLSKRFAEARSELETRTNALDEGARRALSERIAPYLSRIEGALGELKSAREKLQAAIGNPDVARRTRRDLRRAVRRARIGAKRALRQWQSTTSTLVADLALSY
jgi:stearoyl-CoA desaturase (delta-9 desaturase)